MKYKNREFDTKHIQDVIYKNYITRIIYLFIKDFRVRSRAKNYRYIIKLLISLQKNHLRKRSRSLFSFTWRKTSVHIAHSVQVGKRSGCHPRVLHLTSNRKGVPPRSSNLNTFTAHESSRWLAPVVSGSAGYLPVDLSIECITFAHVNIARISGRKMARVVRPQRLTPWYIVYVSRRAYVVWDTCLFHRATIFFPPFTSRPDRRSSSSYCRLLTLPLSLFVSFLRFSRRH